MIVPASAFATALNAMRAQVRRADHSAEAIASAGLEIKPPADQHAPPAPQVSAVTPPEQGNHAELAVSMQTMLTAQRSVMEQQRVMEAARIMVGQAIELQVGAPKP